MLKISGMCADSQPARVMHYTWAAIFALIVIDGVWLQYAGVTLGQGFFLDPAAALGGLFTVTAYGHVRPVMPQRYRLAANAVNQFAFGMVAIIVFTYLGARLDFPLVDKRLAAMDSAMGCHWQDYLSWMNAHPSLAWLLTRSYNAMTYDVLLVMILLCCLGQTLTLQRFVIEFLAGCFVAIVIATIWPAVAVFEYQNIAPATFTHLTIANEKLFLRDLYAMRRHTSGLIPYPVAGLVTFPSFHTTAALLCCRAVWSVVWWIRLPFIALNALMIASTPFDGGHYIIDVVGGIALSAGVILLSQHILPARIAADEC